MKRINPGTLTNSVTHLISHITVASSSRLAFVSGQVALNEKGELIGKGNYELQVLQVFTNLSYALEALNAGPEHIVQMKIHVVDHQPELVEVIFNAGFQLFGTAWPLTASTYLGVQSLALPDWLIEVDMIVELP
ncbi:RidA family protein [Paenibacillus sepulcri]|uniref:RidA family protein n=1 Tax=Paenibacillus sepulcri TaxID=359917 RepID=A0ABS7C827_9BACL|nr:RidA family protein [Paenibacillus sepulcri]